MVKKKKPKKVKSVERQKISSTAVLNDSNMNNNQQQVQIIFPADMELRKVKKRKKSDEESKKKKEEKEEKDKLLEELKENLKVYDNLQSVAAEKKIQIPSELGVSMISKSDLKTNEDIKTFIEDVKNKSQKIQELIAEKEQALSAPTRSFPMRLGGGIIRLPTEPSLFPPQPPLQPQIIPPTPIPTQTITTPSQTTPRSTQATTTQTDPTLEALQKIAQETQTELEKSGVDVPEAPKSARNPLFESEDTNITRTESAKSATSTDTDLSRTKSGPLLPDPDTPVSRPPSLQPVVPPLDISKVQPSPQPEPTPQEEQPQKMKDSDLELFSVPEFEKTQSPPDLYPLYRRLRLYIENVEATTLQGKTVEGVYHIPLENYNGFIAAKTKLINDYQNWFRGLNPNQRIYMVNQPIMAEINKLMLKYTRIEPKELAKEEFKLKGIPVKEITQGNEKPELETAIQERGFSDEEKQKIKIEYNKLLAATSKQITTIEKDLNKTDNTEEDLKKIINDIDELEDNITQTHDKLDPAIKLGVITLYEKTKVRLTNVLRTANQKLDFVVRSPGAESAPPKSPVQIKPPAGPPPAPKQPQDLFAKQMEKRSELKTLIERATTGLKDDIGEDDTTNVEPKDLQQIIRLENETEAKVKLKYEQASQEEKNKVDKDYKEYLQKKKIYIGEIDKILSTKPLKGDLQKIKNYTTSNDKFGTKGPSSVGGSVSRIFGIQEYSRIGSITGPNATNQKRAEVKKLLDKYEREQGPVRVEVQPVSPPS